jgi:transketolase
VDRNGCCILDHTENCVALDPLEDKWRAFGWHVISIDAHNLEQIDAALVEAHENKTGKPIAIIAHSIKGKGVSFMENKPGWHNRMPDAKQIEEARKELSIS